MLVPLLLLLCVDILLLLPHQLLLLLAKVCRVGKIIAGSLDLIFRKEKS